MPVVRMTGSAAFLCALLLAGCHSEPAVCPVATAQFEDIPPGVNHTEVFVEVPKATSLGLGLDVITELTAISGSFADPFARETIYRCDHDVSGEVEICVNAKYADGEAEKGGEDPNVGASYEYIRTPHVRLPDPLDCSETKCAIVTCPEEKNACPVVSSLTVEPMVVPEGGTATIEVVAEDPDDNPEALQTTITARNGTVTDPNASTTTYTCDPDVGGVIPICVVATDGESSCDDDLCTSVRCPAEPLENTCPFIEDFRASPILIPPGEETTTVFVDAVDPDELPEPLVTEFTSASGAFTDPFASETTFRCGESGDVELFVTATDGDPECDETDQYQTRSRTVRCPSDTRLNLCPMLFIINPIPRDIALGDTSTRVETRGQDTDGLPVPLVLTLEALWGSFENTRNIQEGNNVVAQNATYVCDRPGEIEVCVVATDGACVKTLCDFIVCPPDIPTPP